MNKSSEVYFISGVCGVGKSSVLAHLKGLLPASEYDIHDFDERGVPDGGGFEWHSKETLYWLELASKNNAEGRSTIIGGFAEPERFKAVYKPTEHPKATLFLLHASGETIRKRLMGRYPTSESIEEINRASGVPLNQFVENNVSYAPELRSIFEKENAPIIETDTKTSEEVAKEIAHQILGKPILNQ